jgi:hypothetical protein
MGFTVLLLFISQTPANVASLHWPSMTVLMSALLFVFGEAIASPRPRVHSCERCKRQIPAAHGRDALPPRFCYYCGGNIILDGPIRVCQKCAKYCGDYCTACGGPSLICYHAHEAYPSNPRPMDVCTVRICKQGHISHESSGPYCGTCGSETSKKQHPYLDCSSCGNFGGLYSPGNPPEVLLQLWISAANPQLIE